MIAQELKETINSFQVLFDESMILLNRLKAANDQRVAIAEAIINGNIAAGDVEMFD